MSGIVEGLNETIDALNAEIGGIEKRTSDGVLAAAMTLLGFSQRQVPREHGDLVRSGFARKAQDNALVSEVGYSQGYALFVHENLEQKLKGKPRPSGLGVYWGPEGAGPKFLERPANEKQREIVNVIAAHAEVK